MYLRDSVEGQCSLRPHKSLICSYSNCIRSPDIYSMYICIYYRILVRFEYFEFYFMGFRRSKKLEPFSAAIFKKALCIKWLTLGAVCCSFKCIDVGYRVHKELWDPNVGEAFVS